MVLRGIRKLNQHAHKTRESPNPNMIQCSKCQNWTHFKYTRLPVYVVYTLTSTSRRYDCEECTKVPSNFTLKLGSHEKVTDNKKQEIRKKTEGEEENTKQLEIVSSVERSVVEAITKTHDKNQDDLITNYNKISKMNET